ncbi:MAG: DUF3383 family protein [Bacteroidales bacterium]|nr:DUF3383 family protein [Candidatus Scybalousia scybalohippi]
MSELSISNIIRVTVQGLERSKTAKNVNEVALFTTETPNNSDPFMIAIDPSDIVNAYGTDSLTAKMANNVFAQNSNLNSGRGYLVVIPMQSAVSATAETFETTDLTSAVSSFKSVTDGSLNISVDGKSVSLANLNFSSVSNVNDIAKVISNATKACWVSVSSGKIKFSAKKVGADSAVVLSSGTGGTDISASQYLNVSGGTTINGSNSSGEKLSAAIARVKESVRFTGIIDNLMVEDDEAKATSAYINSNDMIWVHAFCSIADIQGVATDIKSAGQKQTRCLVYTNGLADACLMAAAYAGRAFSVNFSGSATSQTMNLKTLVNVLPDEGITQTDYAAAKIAGCDLYVSYEGDSGVLSTGGNGYFDTIYENMALKFNAQVAVYNVLKTTGTKIPQTETGVSVLKDALAQVFIQFVRNGVLAPGKWNNAQTFGDPETFRENIAQQGWYIYSMPIAEQAQSEREQRIAPVIQGACKRAGAIHEADVLIIVEE